MAFSIETPDGSLLFDTGQSGDALLHNAVRMEIDRNIMMPVLSHAHYDHTGGLEQIFSFSRPDVALYANPDLFRKRLLDKEGSNAGLLAYASQKTDITRHAHLHLSAEPVKILPRVWTTGEIVERPDFEGRSAHHFIQVGEDWQPHPTGMISHSVLQTSQGLVVVCGCCHAGLLNVLAYIRSFLNHFGRLLAGHTGIYRIVQLGKVIATLV